MMVASRGLAAWKGILLFASGLWMMVVALLVRLFADDCWPNLPPVPTGVLYAGIIAWLAIACVPIALAPAAPTALIRAALVSGAGSFLAATGWAMGVFRAHHPFCERIDHFGPSHHRHPIPGDVGPLLLYAYSATALVTSAPVIVVCLVGGMIWQRRQRSAAN